MSARLHEESEENEEYKKRLREQKTIEEKLKSALRIALDEAAYERLMNVAHANNEVFGIAAQHVLTAYQQARRKITDEELLYILRAIQQKVRREPKITFIGK